jgi:DNA polymerase-1
MSIYFITKQTTVNDADIICVNNTDILHEYFQKAETIGADTETTGFDPYTCRLLCAQFGDKYNQYVLNCNEFDIKEFKPYLEDKNKGYIFQNAKFDLRFFLSNGIDIANVMDTFLAELILTTGYDKEDRERLNAQLSLDYLATKYCGAQLDKSIRGVIHREGLTPRVIRYAAEDVIYLHEILEKQLERINEQGLENVMDLECRTTRVFAKMEHNGVLIDTNEWGNIATITEENTKNLAGELDDELIAQATTTLQLGKFVENQLDMFGGGDKTRVNWSSAAQKKEILETCGLDMKDGVGDRELQRNKKKNPLIPLMIDYSKQAKLTSAFGKAFLKFVNKVSGRIHYNIWPILATGRISVSEPNLNQIPSKGALAEKIRSCFIPREGYKIVGGDYSGMELRIIAEFSKDPLWVNAFKDGEDLHSLLCSKTFDIPIEDVKKPFPGKPDLKYRDVQKTINFGLAYGMSEFKLADTMQIKVDDAKKLIDKFFAVVPKVQGFLEACANYSMQKGLIKTAKPFNRIRYFAKHNELVARNDNGGLAAIGRAGKNTPIQGTNGDVIKLALIKAQEYIDKNNYPAYIILAVYDEIQTECREDKAEEWKEILNNIMIEAAEVVIKDVPVVVDCGVHDYWEK